MQTALQYLNGCSLDEFVAQLGGLYEHSPWITDQSAKSRPFDSLENLESSLRDTVDHATAEVRLSLIRHHPDLAGKLGMSTLTDSSRYEQTSIGLDRLQPKEFSKFSTLNEAYKAKFGFPFIICVRLNTKESILAAFELRLHHSLEDEIETAVQEIHKIAHLRFQLYLQNLAFPV